MKLRPRALVVLAGAVAAVLTPVGVVGAVAAPPGGSASQKIVGGTTAPAYSFMASLQTRQGEHFCGAVLISSVWLVTAAHCVDGESPSDLRIRVGSSKRSSGGSVVRVSRLVKFPGYDPSRTGSGDIALVKVTRAVKQTPIVVAATSPKVDTKVRILGWGQTCPFLGCSRSAPVKLKQLDTSVLRDARCGNRHEFSSATELCVKSPSRQGACFGDSGGPALVAVSGTFRLVGATSRGTSSACGAGPVVYTDVTAYRIWIRKTTHAPV